MSSNQRISMNSGPSGSRVTINGKTYDLPPGNVSINNGAISINGRAWFPGDGASVAGIVALHIHGEPLDVISDAPVTVHGNVLGKIHAGGSITCGDVGRRRGAEGYAVRPPVCVARAAHPPRRPLTHLLQSVSS